MASGFQQTAVCSQLPGSPRALKLRPERGRASPASWGSPFPCEGAGEVWSRAAAANLTVWGVLGAVWVLLPAPNVFLQCHAAGLGASSLASSVGLEGWWQRSCGLLGGIAGVWAGAGCSKKSPPACQVTFPCMFCCCLGVLFSWSLVVWGRRGRERCLEQSACKNCSGSCCFL